MRNLKLVKSLAFNGEDLSKVSCISIDYDTGQVYMASDSCLLALDLRTHKVCILNLQHVFIYIIYISFKHYFLCR